MKQLLFGLILVCCAWGPLRGQALTISECGTLVQDAGGFCVVFEADSTGNHYQVSNTGTFQLGDQVFVEGLLNQLCPTICWSISGCIDVTTIMSCSTTTPIDVCGTLVDGGGCARLETFTGESYDLSTPATFVFGDAVHVTGELDASCTSSCGAADGCISVAAVQFCDDVPFLRGDVNHDGSHNLSDVIVLLGSLFGSPPVPLLCDDSGDTNDDGSLNLGDAIVLLNVLFVPSAMPMPEPSSACGFDSAADSLTCYMTGC